MDYQSPPQTLGEADASKPAVTLVVPHFQRSLDLTISGPYRVAQERPPQKPFGDALVAAQDFNVVSSTHARTAIASRHFQNAPHRFNQQHQFTSLRVDTADHGSWAIYNLSPNSEWKNSLGILKVADSTIFRLGSITGEASIMRGIVTGYKNYPLPVTGFNLRLTLFQTSALGGQLSIGTEMSAMPYVGQQARGGKMNIGVVGTSPYLSIKFTPDNIGVTKPRGMRM